MNLRFRVSPGFERLFLTGALLFATAGCMPELSKSESNAISAATKECGGAEALGCYFSNSPVALDDEPVKLPGRPYTFFRTARGLTFVDGTGKSWNAPDATLTDGASIPPLFVPIVGSPRTPEFANAAAVHDAYCGIGNEQGTSYHRASWQEVHRMFYDTLVVGGTPQPKAQLMFAAVWLGGPRWYPTDGRADTTLDRLPAPIKTRAMIETKAFIAREGPDMAGLIRYLKWQEKEMAWEAEVIGWRKAPASVAQPLDPNGPTAGGSTSPKPGPASGGGQGAVLPGSP